MEKDRNTDRQHPDVVAGRNAVLEALRSGRTIDKIDILSGETKGSIGKIVAMARDAGIPVRETTAQKLDKICPGVNHQGVAAYVAAHDYAELDDIFAKAEALGEAPFLLICDELEDPHNLGAIIRSAEACGAHGIVIPKRRSVGLTSTVYKTAAGACEYVPVARVSNLASAIDEMKKRGVWIYGADMDGTQWCTQDYTGGVGLVIGAEGFGISRLIREKCDFIVSLPMRGKISSLNASVAAGILMYEVARQRLQISAK
ncbi:23S rRNA (guanosine(2251)-2'-O)-methyltransferase RlmB [Zongyangia hominis]|uniref:23S rRNA (Guanosine(2251)-2'-O)-methyltransferase RlmB n=1 Tax=Zongyangia hominis TaxID=2763677 RepID=A0A926ICE0_9FIRM|nr:23S rRNA (guanosine(2251)-2'-O)-methyltransferase RlmB [Zongyangia hominis]MBC8571020.1 23S rRNA (guanosine(2251)-2'-O)-methyltransferase RlmB [Zongyangia hominis]